MKVMFVGNDKSILTGENGDARERMGEYAKYFDKLYIIVFCLKKDNLQKVIRKNLEIYPTNSHNRWFFIYDALKILKTLKIDLISTQDPFIAGSVGVIVKLLFKIKLNIQVHNNFFGSRYFHQENLQNYIFYWLGKFNLLFADTIRIVNRTLLNDKRCFVAPIATDLDFFWSLPHRKRYNQIVTIARLSKQKNLPLFFTLARQFPGLKFLVIGEGEERKNLEKILPQNVFLLGQKNREEVKNIFAKSDIFILTSNYEGWGISVVEALAAGLPVIMTDTGSARELEVVVADGEKALVAETRNLLNNPQKSRKLVLDSQKLLKEDYNEKDLVQQFINGLKKA